ncbi:MAG TPA: CarD family transcriptional regulator [Minicystis sp.]|nr:CarD family transcriptional regulator [Minicystis sp.]
MQAQRHVGEGSAEPLSRPADAQSETKFAPGDVAVHPAHGVGQVVRIERRQIGGKDGAFYVLQIEDSGLKVMVAVGAADIVGLRPVMSAAEAERVLEVLRAPEVAVDVQPWARRHRIYTEMLKSGSPYEIAKVLRDMIRLRFDKDLSFGERRLLDQAKGLLVHELSRALDRPRAALEQEIQGIAQG